MIRRQAEGVSTTTNPYTLKLTGIADAQPGADEAKSGVAEVCTAQNDITRSRRQAAILRAARRAILRSIRPRATTYYVWVKDAAGNERCFWTMIYRVSPEPGRMSDWEITWEDEDAAAFSLFATETWTNKTDDHYCKNIRDNLSGISDVRISDAPMTWR